MFMFFLLDSDSLLLFAGGVMKVKGGKKSLPRGGEGGGNWGVRRRPRQGRTGASLLRTTGPWFVYLCPSSSCLGTVCFNVLDV